MGRPKVSRSWADEWGSNLVQIAPRVPRHLVIRLRSMAIREDRSVQQIVTEALTRAVEKHEAQDKRKFRRRR
jgi:hypothetical protein